MTEHEGAHIAAREPVAVEVTAGKTYLWCSCGRSRKQPFCDGSHGGTPFLPVIHKAEKSETVWFCMCKRSGAKPFCDGSHAKI